MLLNQDNLKSLPRSPGCYIYKDRINTVLYVGKALNLKSRINSYFQKNNTNSQKIENMLKEATSLEFFEVDSEAEALILETNLIKKYRPKYNTLMKDDKNYVWVMFPKEPFARPEVVREKKSKNAEYFGPFPSSFPARQVLKQLRQLFPFCNTKIKIERVCVNGKTRFIGANERPCLDYYIGLCSGVCSGEASLAEHNKNMAHIKRFFKGEKHKIYKKLERQMHTLAKNQNFEEAAKIRDKLKNLFYVTQKIKLQGQTTKEELEIAKKDYLKQSEIELLKRLNIYDVQKENSYRIECYDISNFQGMSATGSMVVFVDGRASKNSYRKFRIKTKDTPDDFYMMREVLERRLERAKKNDSKFLPEPDLVIVDGGKGQLSSAYETLKKHNLHEKISLVGLAKREEELFQIFEESEEIRFSKTTLPNRSKALYLVQRIRDEAHRFAIGYHKVLRSKKTIKSALSQIPGVGPLIEKRLIKAFGSLEGVKKASKDQLQTVVRNKKTVEAIQKLL